jgi:hypothetical protein
MPNLCFGFYFIYLFKLLMDPDLHSECESWHKCFHVNSYHKNYHKNCVYVFRILYRDHLISSLQFLVLSTTTFNAVALRKVIVWSFPFTV